MGVRLSIVFMVWASFLGTGFEDGSWRPQKPQNKKKCDTFFKLLGFNCGLAGQVHGHSHCSLQVQQVVFTADVQTRRNPWPQSLQ